MTAPFLVWRDLCCRVLFLRTISNNPATVLAAICELHYKSPSGSVAQSVEQRPFKALVPGSSPGRPKHTPRPPPDFSSSSSYGAAVPPALSSRAWRNRASVERENGSGARRSWPGALAWSQPLWRCAGLNPPAPFLRARRRELRFRSEPRPRTHQPTLRARHTCNHLSRPRETESDQDRDTPDRRPD